MKTIKNVEEELQQLRNEIYSNLEAGSKQIEEKITEVRANMQRLAEACQGIPKLMLDILDTEEKHSIPRVFMNTLIVVCWLVFMVVVLFFTPGLWDVLVIGFGGVAFYGVIIMTEKLNRKLSIIHQLKKMYEEDSAKNKKPDSQ